MACDEVGGNYCLSNTQIELFRSTLRSPSCVYGEWNDVVFTSSARSATRLTIESLNLQGKTILLPNFTCYAVTNTFIESGCICEFYKVKKDLSIDLEDVMRQIDIAHPQVIYLCSLFGFDTNLSIKPYVSIIKSKGILIIEDITHSVFSNRKHIGDIILCSLRKWLEIPDGGFVCGLKINSNNFYQSSEEQSVIVSNFIKASLYKNQYLKNSDDELKKIFLPLYYKNNEFFDNQKDIYKMSCYSYTIFKSCNIDSMIRKRRENYEYLQYKIHNPMVKFVFDKLPNDVCPLYFEIYLKNGLRNMVQEELIQEKLYCPIIWPTPPIIEKKYSTQDICHHNDILSLVIDQRYDFSDMERIVNCINKIKFHGV